MAYSEFVSPLNRDSSSFFLTPRAKVLDAVSLTGAIIDRQLWPGGAASLLLSASRDTSKDRLRLWRRVNRSPVPACRSMCEHAATRVRTRHAGGF